MIKGGWYHSSMFIIFSPFYFQWILSYMSLKLYNIVSVICVVIFSILPTSCQYQSRGEEHQHRKVRDSRHYQTSVGLGDIICKIFYSTGPLIWNVPPVQCGWTLLRISTGLGYSSDSCGYHHHTVSIHTLIRHVPPVQCGWPLLIITPGQAMDVPQAAVDIITNKQ